MHALGLRRYVRHGTLPQLAALDAVARLGSVTLAAQALHLAQPTVSGHLRKLSEAVGLPLCESNGQRMVLTDAGRALVAAAADVFQALREVDTVLSPLRDCAAAQRAVRHAACLGGAQSPGASALDAAYRPAAAA